MRIFTLVFILLLSFLNVEAQTFNIENEQVSIRPCPNDPNQLISQLEEWEIYQTENDLWDGTRIIACHKVTTERYGQYYLNLDNINLDKAIFYRSTRAPSSQDYLLPNWTYSATANFTVHNENFTYDLNRSCGQDVCTGIIMGIDIPTEDGTARTQRLNKLQFNEDCSLDECISTESFENQRINEFIIKTTISVYPASIDSLFIPCTYFYLEESLDPPNVFDQLIVPTDTRYDTAYHMNLPEGIPYLLYSDIFLGIHAPNIYPKPGNETYIEVFLENNLDTIKDINIYVDEDINLLIQAYTEVIGGKILGSNTERHRVNIIQNGADFCFSAIEFTHGSGTSLTYRAGNISLSAQNSCLKFKKDAQLIIDNADLIYGGNNAAGMLAMMSGSELHMMGKASMTINNTLVVQSTNEVPNEYVDIYLKHDQSLIFAPSAKILNFGKVIIRVHMLGGDIDISSLDEKSQAMFMFVYPEPKENLSDNLTLFPNPFLSLLNFNYNSTVDQIVEWTISDISGKTVHSGINEIRKGNNQVSIQTPGMASGIFFFHLKAHEGGVSKKTIRM